MFSVELGTVLVQERGTSASLPRSMALLPLCKWLIFQYQRHDFPLVEWVVCTIKGAVDYHVGRHAAKASSGK